MRGHQAGASFAAMLRFVNMIFLIALFLGLGVRASGAHFDFCPPNTHKAECCDGFDEMVDAESDSESPPLDHDHDHHHGECCTTPMWSVVKHTELLVFPEWKSGPRGASGNEHPPEGPVLPLDLPPII